MEFWTQARPLPGAAARIAPRAEDDGWDGIAFSDSQNLSGDPFVALAVAAGATSRLQLATGVVNPATRHPAATASAIACVQAESSGRASLGVGRGDSALAYLGRRPVGVRDFRAYVEQVTAYLRGESVPWPTEALRDDELLPLGELPPASRIEWLAAGDAVPVPVWVVGSGPRVIRLAAELADRVVLALGADPERLRWGIAEARAARPEVRIGAYVTVVVDDDRDRARALAAGAVAGMARFSAMHGVVQGPATAGEHAVFERLPGAYDMTRHFESAGQASVVTPEFADAFAVLGPAAHCRERLLELAELGVDRFHVVGVGRGVDPELARSTHRSFVREILGELSVAR